MIPIFLLLGSFLIYKYVYIEPRNWYDHYLYLAKSFMEGRVDIPNLPPFYHDKLEFGGKIYVPFPPGASFLLIPFIYFKESITQQQVSIIIGAFDVLLMYLLLLKLTSKRNSLLLAIFFGFGTSFFWASIVGTTWFFAHVVAIFFMTMSLLFHFKKRHFLSGIFFALAALTRMPMVMGGIFYLIELWRDKKHLLLFLCGASILVPILAYYDWARFGSISTTGYYEIYRQYISGNYPYTILQNLIPNAAYFGYMDIKNIPLHLYTFLIMPPNIEIQEGIVRGLTPSPFGMGILFTSPLLFIALKPKFKTMFEINLYIAAFFSAIPSFLHYMQGWVQFGYRFVLDFIIFLMLLLAIRFRTTKLNLTLLFISVIVNFWGILWAIKLGW